MRYVVPEQGEFEEVTFETFSSGYTICQKTRKGQVNFIDISGDQLETLLAHIKSALKKEERFPYPLSKYGDLMTREEFRASVECGFFTNDDGSAHISNGVMEGHSINVSLQSIDRLPPDVTHIMWFNK